MRYSLIHLTNESYIPDTNMSWHPSGCVHTFLGPVIKRYNLPMGKQADSTVCASFINFCTRYPSMGVAIPCIWLCAQLSSN